LGCIWCAAISAMPNRGCAGFCGESRTNRRLMPGSTITHSPTLERHAPCRLRMQSEQADSACRASPAAGANTSDASYTAVMLRVPFSKDHLNAFYICEAHPDKLNMIPLVRKLFTNVTVIYTERKMHPQVFILRLFFLFLFYDKKPN
jgi:hypothetical protein